MQQTPYSAPADAAFNVHNAASDELVPSGMSRLLTACVLAGLLSGAYSLLLLVNGQSRSFALPTIALISGLTLSSPAWLMVCLYARVRTRRAWMWCLGYVLMIVAIAGGMLSYVSGMPSAQAEWILLALDGTIVLTAVAVIRVQWCGLSWSWRVLWVWLVACLLMRKVVHVHDLALEVVLGADPPVLVSYIRVVVVCVLRTASLALLIPVLIRDADSQSGCEPMVPVQRTVESAEPVV